MNRTLDQAIELRPPRGLLPPRTLVLLAAVSAVLSGLVVALGV